MKKRFSLTLIGVLGFLMLISHQNCAPSSSSMAGGSSFSADKGLDVGSPVSIIDESKSKAAVSFPYPEVQLSGTSSSLLLQGNCLRNEDGTILGWQMSETTSASEGSQQIAQGQASCQGGVFSIQIASNQLGCGKTYKAIAQLGFGSPGIVSISRSCN